jgi:hypothetical protein
MQPIERAHLNRKGFERSREDHGCKFDERDALQQTSRRFAVGIMKPACV